MSDKTKPKVSDLKNPKSGYTSISFKPDLKRFGLTELTDDIVNLMIKRVYDIAATTDKKVKVFYNDEKISISDNSKKVVLKKSLNNDEMFRNLDEASLQNYLKENFPKEWLLPLEMYELSKSQEHLSGFSDEVLQTLNALKSESDEYKQWIDDGLKLI